MRAAPGAGCSAAGEAGIFLNERLLPRLASPRPTPPPATRRRRSEAQPVSIATAPILRVVTKPAARGRAGPAGEAAPSPQGIGRLRPVRYGAAGSRRAAGLGWAAGRRDPGSAKLAEPSAVLLLLAGSLCGLTGKRYGGPGSATGGLRRGSATRPPAGAARRCSALLYAPIEIRRAPSGSRGVTKFNSLSSVK